MNCLIVDSSTKNLYISIIYDNKLVFEKYIAGKNDHAKNIVATIDEGLKENNMTVDCLDRVVCGIGPSAAETTRIAPSICAAPVIIFFNRFIYDINLKVNFEWL